jgi:hypothetical protein
MPAAADLHVGLLLMLVLLLLVDAAVLWLVLLLRPRRHKDFEHPTHRK